MIWFKLDDALIANHKYALFALNELLSDRDFNKYICHGISCGSNDQSACTFRHMNGELCSKSRVILTCIYYDVELTVSELYYYLSVAYNNYLKDDQSEDAQTFAEDLAFFRKACDIKCDQNGNPIMEAHHA